MTTSILEKEYVEPTRPYSQNELTDRRSRLYRNFRLGKNIVRHQRSGYFYRVKANGRKEREMLETDSEDVGNCSVSWKLNKTADYLKDRAFDMVDNYMENFETEPTLLTYRLMNIEETFYRWLYEDQERHHRRPRNNTFNSSYSPDKTDNG